MKMPPASPWAWRGPSWASDFKSTPFLKNNEGILNHLNLFSFSYLLHFLLCCPFVSQTFLLLLPYPTPFRPPLSTSLIANFALKRNVLTSMRLIAAGKYFLKRHPISVNCYGGQKS